MTNPAANTTIRLTLTDQNGSKWAYRLLAVVVANNGAHGSPYDVRILEVSEAPWMFPRESHGTVAVADFLETAERNGITAGEINERLIDRFIANGGARVAS
jgi:hypothetical protein